ncbi:hypothetical protein [Alkalitalea saponilacus]|uniref:hypothetical protein n=1 Tax=Alkalitalea saponilacus TaxID=889453 RepID=UPI001E5152C2|nr:hypothetical protein [Alkalitalea saponilacus]
MSSITEKISIKEKIGYSLGDFAANLIFQTLMTFLAYFYTDVFKIQGDIAAVIIFVGGMAGGFLYSGNGSNCRPNQYALGKISSMDFVDICSIWCDRIIGIHNTKL